MKRPITFDDYKMQKENIKSFPPEYLEKAAPVLEGLRSALAIKAMIDELKENVQAQKELYMDYLDYLDVHCLFPGYDLQDFEEFIKEGC